MERILHFLTVSAVLVLKKKLRAFFLLNSVRIAIKISQKSSSHTAWVRDGEDCWITKKVVKTIFSMCKICSLAKLFAILSVLFLTEDNEVLTAQSILVEIYISKDGNKECCQGWLNFKDFLGLLRKLEGSPSLSPCLLGRSYSNLHYLGLVNMGFGLSIKTLLSSFADKKLSCDMDSLTDTSSSSELFHATADATTHVIG